MTFDDLIAKYDEAKAAAAAVAMPAYYQADPGRYEECRALRTAVVTAEDAIRSRLVGCGRKAVLQGSRAFAVVYDGDFGETLHVVETIPSSTEIPPDAE